MACIGQLTDDLQALQDILPQLDVDYHICEFKAKPTGIFCVFRLPYTSEHDVKSKFMSEFCKQNKVVWRTSKTNPARKSAKRKNIFWAQYHCQNRSVKVPESTKRTHPKHTNCKATLSVTIKRIVKRCRSKDPHMPSLPTVVVLNHEHNHNLSSADSLKYRDVSNDAEEAIMELLKKGYSPSAALNMYKLHLQLKHGEDYFTIAADRAVCPDLPWCFRLFYKKYNKENCAATEGPLSNLEAQIRSTSERFGRNIACMQEIDGEIVVAVCTPLMHRVHSMMPHSGELVFMDSSKGRDRNCNHVFILLTHSCAGGLPLGVFITASESQQVISCGLQLINQLVGDNGFYKHGTRGPDVFITDDSKTKENAITSTYPHGIHMHSIFHILQASWRWLWEDKHGILFDDRSTLFCFIKAMVYAQTEDDLTEIYNNAINDSTVRKYQRFPCYLKELWNQRSQWAVSLCSVRKLENADICEATIRVMKDKLLCRLKAFNTAQLFDFIVTQMDSYYERRILDIISNELDHAVCSRYLPSTAKIQHLEIYQESSDIFDVFEPESEKHHQVNVDLGTCSCTVGLDGFPCEHLYATVKNFDVSCYNFLPTMNQEMSNLLHEIATGSNDLPNDYYLSCQIPVAGELQISNADGAESVAGSSPVLTDWQDYQSENEEIIEEFASSDSASIKQQWSEFSNKILQKLDEQPDVFVPVVSAFLEHVSQLKTDAALASTFYTIENDDHPSERPSTVSFAQEHGYV